MTNELQELAYIRDFIEDDQAFVYATMLNALYYGDSWFSAMPKNVFMDNYKKIVGALINSPKNTIKVACLKEDPSVILGYSILSADFQTIHWVFVKKAWRKQGIAKALLPQRPTSVTHLTDVGRNLLKKFDNCIFNPFNV